MDGGLDDEREPTAWEARVAKAKQDGTWYSDRDVPSPYPPEERRRRFLLAFVTTFVLLMALRVVLHALLGRPGPAFSLGLLLDGLIPTTFLALGAGWAVTHPRRGKRSR